jgi:hypothetical protein
MFPGERGTFETGVRRRGSASRDRGELAGGSVMSVRDRWERLFISMSLGMQVVFVVFFALRKWNFAVAMQVGWLVYGLAIPAVVLSVMLINARKGWCLSVGGLLFALWAVFGTVVDIVHPVAWRSPIVWSIFIPYVLLYTGSQMFYWWPLLKVHRPSWVIFTALYSVSTVLNVTSH